MYNRSIPAYECGFNYSVLKIKDEFLDELDDEDSRYIIISMRCKKKTCSFCSYIKARNIADRITNFNSVDNLRFFTLTSINDGLPLSEKIKSLEVSFRKLYKKLKVKYPTLAYFRIFEVSPSGMVHIHGMWNIYIDIKYLSNAWESLTGAYRCDLRKVKSIKKLRKYLLKYLLKSYSDGSGNHLSFPPNKRLYSFSSNWNKCETPFENKFESIITNKSLEELASWFNTLGPAVGINPDKLCWSENICEDTANAFYSYFDSS